MDDFYSTVTSECQKLSIDGSKIELNPDGQWYRLPATNEPKFQNNKDAAYLCTYNRFNPGKRVVFLRNWSLAEDIGRSIVFEGGKSTNLSPEQIEQRRKIAEELKKQHDAEQEKIWDEKAIEARNFFYNVTNFEEGNHPYINDRQINVYGDLRVFTGTLYDCIHCENNLLIPLWRYKNDDDEMVNFQRIFWDPNTNTYLKRPYKGARKRGCYFIFANHGVETILIAEGYATAASIMEATDAKYQVVMGVDAGNLVYVAEVFRARYPDGKIILCADNDPKKDGSNPGIYAAKMAAGKVGGLVAVCPLIEGKADSDFNDLARIKGNEAVKEVIEKAINENIIYELNEEKKPQPKNSSWPDPILFDKPLPYSFFDQSDMPDLLWDFCNNVSDHVDIAVEAAWANAIVTASNVAMRKAKVVYNNHHFEPLPLFCLTVFPSGNRKTSCYLACINPLKEILKSENSDFEKKYAKIKSRIRVIDRLIKAKEKEIDKLSKDIKTNESKIEEITECITTLEESKPEQIYKSQLYISGNTTPEALYRAMERNNGCCAVFEAEGGFFKILAGLYGHKIANFDLINEAYDGVEYDRNREDEQSRIENPLLAISLSIQPHILSVKDENVKEEFVSSGLFGRFLYIMAESRIGHRLYRTPQLEENIKEAWGNKIKQIYNLYNKDTIILRLTPEAEAIHEQYFNSIEKSMNQDLNGRFCDYPDWGSKAAAKCARIAAIYHLIETDTSGEFDIDCNIKASTMQKAANIMRKLEEHALMAYGRMGVSREATTAQKIFERIINEKKLTYKHQEAWQTFRKYIPSGRSKDLDNAMEVLVNRSIINEVPIECEILKRGRPPKCNYLVNPKIFEPKG